ncbi:hypothetical protein AKJ16_DCAP17616 [Drosera capensis]
MLGKGEEASVVSGSVAQWQNGRHLHFIIVLHSLIIDPTNQTPCYAGGEILVLPFFGQGHLFPCIELKKHLSTRNFTVTLIVSSSLPSSLTHRIHLIPSDPIGPPPSGPVPSPVGAEPFGKQQNQTGAGIERRC